MVYLVLIRIISWTINLCSLLKNKKATGRQLAKNRKIKQKIPTRQKKLATKNRMFLRNTLAN